VADISSVWIRAMMQRASNMITTITLRDRVSGNQMYLTLRDGTVIGAMGSDPARYMGLTEAQARHKARYSQR
jgi:hypothetical protein